MAVTNSNMTLHTDNDNEGGWGGTDGSDAYNNSIQGTNSESWQVSKNSTETGTLTKTANMGTSKYFTFYMASNLAPYYTDVKLEVRTDANNYEQFQIATSSLRLVSGDFHPVVVEFGEGTTTGTLDITSIADVRIILDNSTSGNIRSVINNWIDTMWYGSGRTIGGTTASDKLFLESHTLDTTTNDSYDGCSELYKGSLAYQTDITVATTTGNSYGETLTFASGNNTSSTYTLTVTGTAIFNGTSIIGAGATVNLTATSATSFDMLGGSLVAPGTTVFASGQDIKGVVLTDRTSITHGASNFENNTISSSGVMAVSSTGTCTGNTFNKPTGTSAISLADLSHAPTNTFVSDGSSHAVELTAQATSMTWSGETSGFDSGSTGSPVTPTSTGNEDIYITATSSSDITINVASGATTPSIRVAASFTGAVNVVAGLLPISFTVKSKTTGLGIPDANVMMQRKDTKATIVVGTTDINGLYSESVAASYDGVDYVGWIRQMDLTDPDYVGQDIQGTITSAGADISVSLEIQD